MTKEDDFFTSLEMRINALEEKVERLAELEEKFIELQEENILLRQTIEFWHGPVPRKYKKFNPAHGEYPFFRKRDHFVAPEELRLKWFGTGNLDRPDFLPTDKEEFKNATDRMKSYALKNDKVKSKLATSEASSTPSASQDSHQAGSDPSPFPS